MKRFADRHVLVTGGASGIGRAAVHRFAWEGARVSILDRAMDMAQEVCDALPDSSVQAFEADVTDPDGLKKAVEDAISAQGDLHVLFANAGIGGGGLVAEMSGETWETVIRTNLNGIFYTCKFAIPSLIRNPGAAIVTMASSMAGWDTSLGGAAYMASKEGVTGLTKSLALQLGRFGVRVNAICPGVIETLLGGGSSEERAERYAAFARRIPMRRVGQPEDVAAAVAFLASDDARHITGSMLLIDGGQTLQSWSNAPDLDAFPLDFDPDALTLND
jgi:NAD(P)-dependent dehydrogenase (short-subunit alcohol dehydrogenase family)